MATHNLKLTITVTKDVVDEVIDSINETLNTLVRVNVLSDEDDDAWRWTCD